MTIESRRGEVALYARADDGSPRGAVFVPFCYYEAATNMLTNPALDPFGKIPGVQVLRGAPHAWRRAGAADELRRWASAGTAERRTGLIALRLGKVAGFSSSPPAAAAARVGGE